MKRIIIFLAALAALAVSCKKDDSNKVDNTAAATKFEAWIRANYPDATKTGLGAYITYDRAGTGKEIGTSDDNQFVLLEFTKKTLDGTISGYTYESVAKQLAEYNPTYLYGARAINRASSQNMAALDESLCGMRVGGERTLAIPGWLTRYVSYGSAEEYFKNVNGTDVILEFKVVDAFNDITEYESSEIEKYIKEQGLELEKFKNDTVGFYYLTTKAPELDRDFVNDDTLHINYTGMRLDGQIFDSSIRNTCVDAGLDIDGRTFNPVQVIYNTEYGSITFGSGSAINGFSMALAKLHPGECATVIMSSELAYGISGGDDTGLIPGYCPLRFDIQITDYSFYSEEDTEEDK